MTHAEMFRPSSGAQDPAPKCPGRFVSAGEDYPAMHCSACMTTARIAPFGQVRWLKVGYRSRQGRRGQ